MLGFWSWVRRPSAAPREAGALVLDSLSDDRLGDLLGALLYTSARWRKLRRYAFAARAEPDFVGEEDRSPDVSRRWWVKVVRPAWNGATRLPALANQLLARREPAPDVLLIATTFDAGPDEAGACIHAAERLGVPNTIVWSRRDLESRLRQDRPDLVFAYFGAATGRAMRPSALAVHRRLEVKRRLLDALLLRADERSIARHPFDKFRHSHVIVRSVSDESYPYTATELGGHPGWYRLATYDALHDGLELLLGTDSVVADFAGGWRRASPGERREQGNHLLRALRIGKLPYERIVEFDLDGDEYYPLPHLYCEFPDRHDPFTDVRFLPVDRPGRAAAAASNV